MKYPTDLIKNNSPVFYANWDNTTDSLIGLCEDSSNIVLGCLPIDISSYTTPALVVPIVITGDFSLTYNNPLGITPSAISNVYNNHNKIYIYKIDASNSPTTRGIFNPSIDCFELIELEYDNGDLVINNHLNMTSSGNIYYVSQLS